MVLSHFLKMKGSFLSPPSAISLMTSLAPPPSSSRSSRSSSNKCPTNVKSSSRPNHFNTHRAAPQYKARPVGLFCVVLHPPPTARGHKHPQTHICTPPLSTCQLYPPWRRQQSLFLLPFLCPFLFLFPCQPLALLQHHILTGQIFSKCAGCYIYICFPRMYACV